MTSCGLYKWALRREDSNQQRFNTRERSSRARGKIFSPDPSSSQFFLMNTCLFEVN